MCFLLMVATKNAYMRRSQKLNKNDQHAAQTHKKMCAARCKLYNTLGVRALVAYSEKNAQEN